MAFNKYAGIFPIILGIVTIIGVFIPLGIGIIDMGGLAGWKIKFSSSPLGVVTREPIGVLGPFLESILGPIVELFIPTLTYIINPTIIGYIMLLLSFLIIIFGILQLKKSESIAYPIVNIVLAVIFLILPVLSYLVFAFNIFPEYLKSYSTIKALVSTYYFPNIIYLPMAIDQFPTIGFYLIVISQIIVIMTSTAALIITAIQKKKGKI
jgi:hypothetical protein